MNKKNKNNFTNDQLLKFYEKMYLIRKFEEKAAQLYGAGKIIGEYTKRFFSISS